jgi:hypothetical protein
MKVKFRLNQAGEEASIDIPQNVWDAYLKRTQEIMPEQQDKAWAAFLINQIAAVLGDKSVYLLNDIPQEVMTAFEKVCQEASLEPGVVLPRIMQAALLDRLHITNFMFRQGEKPEATHIALITNIPTEAWQAIHNQAIAIGLTSAENFLGNMFEGALSGGFTITKQVS